MNTAVKRISVDDFPPLVKKTGQYVYTQEGHKATLRSVTVAASRHDQEEITVTVTKQNPQTDRIEYQVIFTYAKKGNRDVFVCFLRNEGLSTIRWQAPWSRLTETELRELSLALRSSESELEELRDKLPMQNI